MNLFIPGNFDQLILSMLKLDLLAKEPPAECSSALPNDLNLWSENLINKRLLNFSVDENPIHDLPNIDLISALAGEKPNHLKHLLKLVESVRHENILSLEDWKSWIATSLSINAQTLNESDFKSVVTDAIARAKSTKENGNYRTYPIPFFPISQKSLNLFGITDGPGQIKTFLYSQIHPSLERGFPYGFASLKDYQLFSQQFNLAIHEGLKTYLTETISNKPNGKKPNKKPVSKSHIPPTIPVIAKIGGSLASGISFRPKNEAGSFKRAVGAHSDFDIDIIIPEKIFNTLRDSINAYLKTIKMKFEIEDGRWSAKYSPPLKPDSKDTLSGNVLNQMNLYDSLHSLQEATHRELGIKFKNAKFEDPDSENSNKPPAILIDPNI